jgi:hypothetical protein
MEVAIEGPRSEVPQEQALIGPIPNIETSRTPFNVPIIKVINIDLYYH